MLAEHPEVKFEIGHVLFIDIVGYSKLLITEQSAQLQTLKEIVRGTEQVRRTEAEAKLLRLPTGDGGALVFRTSPEAPVRCAMEIAKALKEYPKLRVRMGIHSGPVNEISDLNEQANIAGAGINMAQRVMDCGDAGHILLSRHVAEDLEQYPQWRSHLHEVGEYEVKHGVRVSVVNFYTDEVGNPEVPEKFKTVRAAAGKVPAKSATPKSALIGAAILILVAIAIGGFLFWERGKPKTSAMTAVIQEKSIAVLPLVNTSGDPGNDYFSDGLSEELIAVLAKIPRLKIIGRSSSFLFKGKSDDSRTIGEKLGVANLLEGSVRKQGDRVRIVAELINAADGRALWSDTYDRELKDVFAVQSEIATAVAEQLQIKLLGAPARSDAAPSNNNLEAYNALQQGTFYFRMGSEEGTEKATQFYGEAIRLDPRYALAYAYQSFAWRQLAATWLAGSDANAAYAKARNAAQTALSLAPDLAEAHEALGWVLLTPDFDFAAAETEFQKAGKLTPADARAKNALSFLFMAEGRLAEAEDMTRKALASDPLAVLNYLNLARVLIAQNRYDEAEAAARKALELQPAAARLYTSLTTVDLLRGNTAKALQDARQESAGFWRDYALALATQQQSDRTAADAALQKLIHENAVNGPFQIAAVYGLRKDPDKMFEWLDRAYTGGDPGLMQLLVTPFILTYKNDPRFAALCQKLKIPVPTAAGPKP
jgi:TolB-like protein/Flp pilus assembly protein TadD